MKRLSIFKVALAPALLFGHIGILQAGTCTPPCEVEGTAPEIRMLNTDTHQDWEIEANLNGFEIDQNGGTNGTGPFQIEPSANSDQLVLDDNGNIGINTGTPQSSNEVEVAGNSGASDTFAAIAISPGGPGDDSARMAVSDFSDTFSIGVRTGGGGYNSPVAIDLDAGNNKLTMNSSGRVGIGGLTIAQIVSSATLHVAGSGGLSGNIFLDNIGTQDDWLIDPGGTGLLFRNGAATNSPAVVTFGSPAPVASLVVETNTGDVGIGLASPTADLHVRGEGVLDAGSNAEQVLRLESAVPPEMAWADTGSGNEWVFRMNGSNNFKMNYNDRSKFTFSKNGNLKIAGNLIQGSDRYSKTAIIPVDNQKVLDAVVDLPISTWEYKQNEGVKHLGPMAQDFHSRFGLGDNPKGISSIDTGGVALAAIKGLNEIGQSRDEKIMSLTAENEKSRIANEELNARLTMLENLVNKLTAKEVAMTQ